MKAVWKGILEKFYNDNVDDFWSPLLLESWFKLHIDDFLIAWRFDRVDKVKDKQVSIIDYKTSWAFKLNDDVNDDINELTSVDREEDNFDLQLCIYALALKQMHYEPVDAYLYYISTWIKKEYDIRENSLDRATELIRSTIKWIRGEKFVALPEKNKCKHCSFRSFCNYWL